MAKINIKLDLKSSEGNYTYCGSAIYKNNEISYSDNKIITKIKITDDIVITRKSDCIIILTFKNKKVKGTYVTSEGSFVISGTITTFKKEKNSIKIHYLLKLNNVKIDNFELNLLYSIDTK